MRCWGLWHYNDCDDILRPAYGGAASGSSVEELTAAAFEKLLSDTLRPAQDSMGMGGNEKEMMTEYPKESQLLGAYYGY